MQLILVFIPFLFASLFMSSDAHSCGRSSYEGFWSNIRSESNILSKLEIKEDCDRNTGTSDLRVRAFETCSPRDCSWGWADGVFQNSKLYVLFRTFSAERRVEIIKRGFRLRVRVMTDYISDNRKDTIRDFILIKKAG